MSLPFTERTPVCRSFPDSTSDPDRGEDTGPTDDHPSPRDLTLNPRDVRGAEGGVDRDPGTHPVRKSPDSTW